MKSLVDMYVHITKSFRTTSEWFNRSKTPNLPNLMENKYTIAIFREIPPNYFFQQQKGNSLKNQNEGAWL